MLIQDIIQSQIGRWDFVCAICGGTFTKTGPNTKVCAGCRPLSHRKYHRARYKKNLGDVATCVTCQRPFNITQGQQTRCKPCRDEIELRSQRCICRDCGLSVQRTSNRQVCCDGCRTKRKRMQKAADYQKGRASEARSQKKLAYAISYSNMKYRTDARFNISRRMSCAINRCLKSGKGGNAWEKIVGYSVADLMAHLERQFLPGMTFSNREQWDIDHIIPLSAFRFSSMQDEGFRAAWALTNLRPLWASDNRRKGARRIHLI